MQQYRCYYCPKEFQTFSETIDHTCIHHQEQDKSSDIEQQPPFGDRQISNIQPQNRGGGLQNQQEHHIVLCKKIRNHNVVDNLGTSIDI